MIPALAVDRGTAAHHTLLAVTYYFDRDSSCRGLACEIQAGFTSSLDGGETWSEPQVLSDPMQLGWLAQAPTGGMVGDYIATSFLAGQQRVMSVFPIALARPTSVSFDQRMFVALEKVRGEANGAARPPAQVGGSVPERRPTD